MDETAAREHRRALRARWQASASGWAARREPFARATMPVSAWMVDAIEPQPGHDVLELAAGAGDTGLLAAELIAPTGTLTCSDAVPEMLDVARARAEELGITNVRFRQLDAELLDVDAGSQDAVLCRWGFMLLADPDAALAQSRRVLRTGGRLALAAWTGAEENPWSAAPRAALRALGLEPSDPGEGGPGQFAWAPDGVVAAALDEAGFADVEVERIPFSFPYADTDGWLASQADLSPALRATLAGLAPGDRERLRDALDEQAAGWRSPDGELRVPAATWVATATA